MISQACGSVYRDSALLTLALMLLTFPWLGGQDWLLLSLHLTLAVGFGFWLFHRLERYLPEKF